MHKFTQSATHLHSAFKFVTAEWKIFRDPEIHVICAMFEEIDRFSSLDGKSEARLFTEHVSQYKALPLGPSFEDII
jgi:hypothetical protein